MTSHAESPSVSIIIPAWNLWPLTRGCLESLARHTPAGLAEVIVADNGSTDATAAELEPLGKSLFGERFKTVRLAANMGFSVACNAGAGAASADILFFLNNDTLVTENWLPPLTDALNCSERTGMASPLLIYPEDELVQHYGVVFEPTLAVRHLYSDFPSRHKAVRTKRYFQALSGAAILIARRIFQECGGFNEGYRNGFEDLDLSCTLRKKSLKLVCEPQSRIIHLTSQTPGRNDHDAQNARLLNERHPGACLPDFHHKIMEDGFVPLLSPSLDIYCGLPEAKEAALSKAFSVNFDPERCSRRLESEPVWQKGHELMCGHFERSGQWKKALAARKLQARLFPLAENAAALARTALKAGDREQAETALAAYETFVAESGQGEQLAARARGIISWADRAGDGVIAGLYENWLKKQGYRIRED